MQAGEGERVVRVEYVGYSEWRIYPPIVYRPVVFWAGTYTDALRASENKPIGLGGFLLGEIATLGYRLSPNQSVPFGDACGLVKCHYIFRVDETPGRGKLFVLPS